MTDEWAEEPLFDMELPPPTPVSIKAVKDSLRPRYAPLTLKGRVACHRCVLDVHEGRATLARAARMVRTVQATGEWTPLCSTHADIFKRADGQ
jgi:hypothetical protein